MCFNILKDPVKSISEAKKKRNVNFTMTILLEVAILLGLTATLTVAKTTALPIMFVSSFVVAFLLTFVIGLFFGLIINVIAATLGGKGNYFAGITTITYAITVPAMGLFVASILTFIPVIGAVIGYIFLALSLAYGFSTLYRSFKELYSVDMVTTLVGISILMITLIATAWLMVGNFLLLGALNPTGFAIF
jgi:hypothetical protein